MFFGLGFKITPIASSFAWQTSRKQNFILEWYWTTEGDEKGQHEMIDIGYDYILHDILGHPKCS